MSEQDRRFWPFRPRTSIFSAIAILLGLVSIFVVLRITIEWPSEKYETKVLIGMLLFSLLPIVLTFVDVFIERGGVFEYRGVKIDFSQVTKIGITSLTVPINIGVPSKSVNDSSSTEILGALKQATACDVVIMDLEDGQAWWETRLLVLLAGAVRLRKPEKVVFVGKDGGMDKCFLGWSHPNELLPHLLKAHPQYSLSYNSAMAIARQWELVEPIEPTGGTTTYPQPYFIQQCVNKSKFETDVVAKLLHGKIIKGISYNPNLVRFDDSIANDIELRELLEQVKDIEKEQIIAIWRQYYQAVRAVQHSWMAFDVNTGLPNPLFAEQFLASELGEKVEKQPKPISLVRLEDLFRPVLYKESIDESWPSERQLKEFFDSKSDYLAVTQKGKFVHLVSRLTVLNTIVRTLVEKK